MRDTCALSRVVSRDIHECLLWSGVMQLMPYAPDLLHTHLLAHTSDNEDASNSMKQLQDISRRKIEIIGRCESPASHHFARIFSTSSTTACMVSSSSSSSLPTGTSYSSASNSAHTSASTSAPTPAVPSITMNPRFTVVLGGTVRLEKFIALDNLIDLVRNYITLNFFDIISHHFTSHHITSHHITSHHITSHHIKSHHIT
jgi:hypothetical protein